MYRTTAPAVLIGLLAFTVATGLSAAEFRTLDGTDNNLSYPNQGSAHTPLARMRDFVADPLPGLNPYFLAPSYEDSIGAPRGAVGPINAQGVGWSRLPNPRTISNHVSAQGDRSIVNPLGASDWLWQWGQFVDHDLSLSLPDASSRPLPIAVEDPGDPLYNPQFPFLPFRRNGAAPGTGAGAGAPREQVNIISAYLDGSNVYGTDQERADFLRTFSNGKLKMTVAANGERLLPFNRATDPLLNFNPSVRPGDTPPPADALFLAGDARANEQVGLTAVHTLFVREHNRLADSLLARPDLGQRVADAGLDPSIESDIDQYVYQMSRRAVGAQLQAITYEEFLPTLLGPNALSPYTGYDDRINATPSNEFANAAYRVGHSLLSPQFQLVDTDGVNQGSLPLRDAFFNPDYVEENGVDQILMGLSTQQAQDVDTLVIDDVRNFLFDEGAGGRDLAAVNLQRGRDHGLPSYNDMRRGLGLDARSSFDQITNDASTAARLAEAYGGRIEDVDLWIGAIAEDAVGGGLVGELLGEILTDQFTRTRDGDRFFYLADEYLNEVFPDVAATRLSDVILRNTGIQRMAGSAFLAAPEPAAATVMAGAVFALVARTRTRRFG